MYKQKLLSYIKLEWHIKLSYVVTFLCVQKFKGLDRSRMLFPRPFSQTRDDYVHKLLANSLCMLNRRNILQHTTNSFSVFHKLCFSGMNILDALTVDLYTD